MINLHVRNMFGEMVDLTPWINYGEIFLDGDGDWEIESPEELHHKLDPYIIYSRHFGHNSSYNGVKLHDLLGVKILLVYNIIFVGSDHFPVKCRSWSHERLMQINYMNVIWEEYAAFRRD